MGTLWGTRGLIQELLVGKVRLVAEENEVYAELEFGADRLLMAAGAGSLTMVAGEATTLESETWRASCPDSYSVTLSAVQRTFWLERKKLSGSQVFLIVASLS